MRTAAVQFSAPFETVDRFVMPMCIKRKIIILSNIPFAREWECDGVKGESVLASKTWEIASKIRACDLIVVDGNEATLKVCALLFFIPFLRRPIVAVDLVLREPEDIFRRFKNTIVRRLLRRVGLFVHYFLDVSGYDRCFGISVERSTYVPFKPNLRHRVPIDAVPDGDYVLCLGRSMRDYKTFFEAIASLPHYPVAISEVDLDQLLKDQRRLHQPSLQVPTNVQVLKDDRSDTAMLRLIRNAKLVVVPILKSSLCASGISAYLNSMLLGKCVIISATPGASDVLTDQAIVVPPENPQVLSQAIQLVWEDKQLREKTAAAGHAYAITLGGECELYERVLQQALSWYMLGDLL